MSGHHQADEEKIKRDIQELERLGYGQQLFRQMGGFSNFAISFSIISVLTGAIVLFGYGLKFAGPIINSVGWPVVSLFTLAVAASDRFDQSRAGPRHNFYARFGKLKL